MLKNDELRDKNQNQTSQQFIKINALIPEVINKLLDKENHELVTIFVYML